eukprot:1896622-Prymnesium_polylepis.1
MRQGRVGSYAEQADSGRGGGRERAHKREQGCGCVCIGVVREHGLDLCFWWPMCAFVTLWIA